MEAREEKLRSAILAYDLEVPQERIDQELRFIQLEMRHRMQYDTMSGGGVHINPWAELEEMKEELQQAALYEAKYDLVIRDIISKQAFSVTREELEEDARAMAERQECSLDMVKQFFGQDLAMLEGDIKRRKAEAWLCEQF